MCIAFRISSYKFLTYLLSRLFLESIPSLKDTALSGFLEGADFGEHCSD